MTDRSNFYWGETAQEYEAKRSESSIWKREDDVLAELLGGFSTAAGSLVVDMPVGTGRFIELFESLGYVPLGLDISTAMLRQAETRASPRTLFAVADARQQPIREASVNLIVCLRFAHLVDRSLLAETLREFARVLREDGHLIVGARLHSFASVEGWRRRWAKGCARIFRSAQFRLGRASSRSHSENWVFKSLHGVGLRLVKRREVTVYDDGSYYSILMLRRARHKIGKPPSIELFGLPGVGKTTIARAAIRSGKTGVVDGLRGIKRHSFWKCLLQHPLITSRVMARLLPVVVELRNTAAKRVVISVLRQKISDSSSSGTVLHEEGASHEVWRQLMTGEELSDEFISRVLPVSDATVLLEAPVLHLLERLASKPSPGPISRTLMSASPGGPAWETATTEYERIKRIILSGSRPVYTIDPGFSKTSAVAELEQIVEDLERGLG